MFIFRVITNEVNLNRMKLILLSAGKSSSDLLFQAFALMWLRTHLPQSECLDMCVCVYVYAPWRWILTDVQFIWNYYQEVARIPDGIGINVHHRWWSSRWRGFPGRWRKSDKNHHVYIRQRRRRERRWFRSRSLNRIFRSRWIFIGNTFDEIKDHFRIILLRNR